MAIELDQNADAIEGLGGAARAELQAVEDFGDALDALSGIALPRLDDRARAAEEFNRALTNASGVEERQVAFEAYRQALIAIGVKEQRLAGEEAAKDAERRTNAIRGVVDALDFEAAQLRRTAREQEIYNQLARAGVDIDTAAGRAIAGKAGALFDLRTATEAATETFDTLRGVADSAFRDILNGIKQSSSAGEVLINIANRIADAFFRAGQNAFEALLFGARGTSGGGLPGELIGGTSGGLVDTGQSFHGGGVVGATPVPSRQVPASTFLTAPRLHNGLRPGEFPAILEQGETVLPRGQSSGGSTINNTFYVETPSPRASGESRASVVFTAERMVDRLGRHR